MAFTTSVLMIPGEKYDTLTTSDSGFFFGIAREIEETNGMVEEYSLSHAPYGLPVRIIDQGQPLMAVMLYRAISAIDPNIEPMDVVRYWGPLLFALSLIPIFLVGKELGGGFGGCAAAFFGATLTSSIYWHKVGAFDREPIMLVLAVWTIYLTLRMFKAPRSSIPTFAVLSGLVYGIFGLSWVGALYIAPIVIGGLLFVLLAGFFGRVLRKTTDLFGALLSAVREHLHLIAGVFGMLAVMTLALWVVGGQSPIFWVGFAQTLLGYVGIGAVGRGVSFARYAGEMAPPRSWDEIIYKQYGAGDATILTTFVFGLIVLALIKFCWSRKHWELIAFPWLIVLAGLVWPGMGQIRFERQWWPLTPILAGVGAAVLVSLLRRISFEQFGEWLRHLQKPTIVAFAVCLVATPFIFNAYAVAGRTTPPTEWHGVRGLDEGFMDVFDWFRRYTPENSVVSIQWSFGHVLTGTAERATVADGTETMGELGKWENTATIRPPDYIYYMSDGRGRIYGVDVPAREYHVNGRRVDVQRFPLMDENEFEWILRTYRDNYGTKIDYVIFDASEYNSARNYYNFTQPANILLNAERIYTRLQSTPSLEGQNYVFNFGENRESVVLDMQNRDVYLKTENGNLHLDGYGVLGVDEANRITSYGGFNPPPSTVDIPETLLVFVDANNNVVGAWLIESVSAEITTRPTPMAIRVFTGNIRGIDYLHIAYTSSNGLVKVLKINHVPSLIFPVENGGTNDNTPEFRWSNAVGAVKYELWVDDNADFASPRIRENVSATSYTPPPISELADGAYSWRVMAFRSDNTVLGWSPTWTFFVDTKAPGSPQLREPENNAELNTLQIVFTWTEPEPDVTYRIQIDDEVSFSPPYVHDNSGIMRNSYTYSFSHNGIYYWRVRAVDGAGNASEWSDNFKLIVRAPPRAPTLSVPANGTITNDGTPTFRWTRGNADNYRLLVDDDDEFSSPEVDILLGITNSYTVDDEDALRDDNYFWKVISVVGVKENSSSIQTFVIDTNPPSRPALFAPADGVKTNDNTPTFEWTVGAGAAKHRLLVSVDADFTQLEVDTLLDVPENTYTPPLLADDNYWWKVIAIDGAGNKSESPVWTFTIQT
jgi:hypothetical protein